MVLLRRQAAIPAEEPAAEITACPVSAEERSTLKSLEELVDATGLDDGLEIFRRGVCRFA